MLINRGTGMVVADRIFLAQSFWHKLRGLQFKKSIPEGYAYIILDCKSVHTCFMRFDLDVIFVDRTWKVVSVFRNLKPFRMTRPVKDAYAAIELKAANLPVRAGQILTLTGHQPGPY